MKNNGFKNEEALKNALNHKHFNELSKNLRLNLSTTLSLTEYHIHNFTRFFISNGTFLQKQKSCSLGCVTSFTWHTKKEYPITPFSITTGSGRSHGHFSIVIKPK